MKIAGYVDLLWKTKKNPDSTPKELQKEAREKVGEAISDSFAVCLFLTTKAEYDVLYFSVEDEHGRLRIHGVHPWGTDYSFAWIEILSGPFSVSLSKEEAFRLLQDKPANVGELSFNENQRLQEGIEDDTGYINETFDIRGFLRKVAERA